MTTVFGIKHPEVHSAVLVADRQTTMDNEAGLPSGKYLSRKLWASKERDFCFGHSGNFNERTYEFVQKLIDGKFDIEKITKKGYFPELRSLNLNQMGRKVPDLRSLSGIIMATRLDKNPQLYTCFPLGDVEERFWTCAGSGDQKIIEYMNALSVMSQSRDYVKDNGKTQMEDVLRVGLEAVRRAQGQDIYSHGLDMLVVTPEKINDHYTDLGDDFGKKLEKIQKQYKKK